MKALAIGAGVLIASQYFASFVLLWWFHLDPRDASPLTIARFALYYGDNPVVRRVLWNTSLAGFAPVLLSALPLLLPRRPSLHGDARFARWSEIARAGLFAKSGLFLGRVGRRYLMLGGQQGVLLAAPPRAEKGTAIVIPNLLLWPDSLICLDIKRENWTLTAGWRESLGQECFLFDPLAEDGETACWNPLAYVSSDPNHRISDVQRIAAMLYPDAPRADPFWTSGARSYFLGVTMYVLETASLPANFRRGAAPGHGLRQRRLRASLAADHRGTAEGAASFKLAVQAGALRDHRLGAGDGLLDPQDVHLATGSLCQSASRSRDVEERFRPARSA